MMIYIPDVIEIPTSLLFMVTISLALIFCAIMFEFHKRDKLLHKIGYTTKQIDEGKPINKES